MSPRNPIFNYQNDFFFNCIFLSALSHDRENPSRNARTHIFGLTRSVIKRQLQTHETAFNHVIPITWPLSQCVTPFVTNVLRTNMTPTFFSSFILFYFMHVCVWMFWREEFTSTYGWRFHEEISKYFPVPSTVAADINVYLL